MVTKANNPAANVKCAISYSQRSTLTNSMLIHEKDPVIHSMMENNNNNKKSCSQGFLTPRYHHFIISGSDSALTHPQSATLDTQEENKYLNYTYS